jgi:hypothetical protein
VTDSPAAGVARSGVGISALAVTLVVGYRLLAVSNYQPPTALGVSRSQGAGSTVLGTVIPLIPASAPSFAFFLAVGSVCFTISGRYSPAMTSLVYSVGFLVLAALVSDAGTRPINLRYILLSVVVGLGIIITVMRLAWAPAPVRGGGLTRFHRCSSGGACAGVIPEDIIAAQSDGG